MPELPEVETVRRTLAPLLGRKVTAAWGSGLPLHMQRPVDIASIRRAMTGGVVEGVRRWGKYLFVDLEGRSSRLVVHLGMTGRLRISAASEPRPKHTHVALALARGRAGSAAELRFTDPRRFGQVFLVEQGRERAHPNLARLGEDPLTGDVSGRFLYERSRGRRGQLKTFLLDQSVIAGVGNIYASEALWQAQIRPTLAPAKLSKPRAQRLADAVNGVLEHALRDGGTSLRDFVAADGKTGEHAEYLKVYGREGESCPRRGCEGRIRRTVLGGRATFSCPRCQSR
jgi:formamidopyrimidine-DNA glycosylase